MSIKVENLKKAYKVKGGADVAAIKGVSFNLPDTGMIFILGKSGCGKSTLLNLLGGLDGFDDGDIVIDGKSMKGYKAKDYDRYRNKYVGFVFQENNLLEEYTVERNVGFALDLQNERAIEGKVSRILERVELDGFEQRKCNSISGGQKQRVAIARALIKEPKLLLCDEPTGALDSETGTGIFTLLKEISKTTLVIVVSHDRDSAETYGDRIIEIKDGEVICDSSPLNEIVVLEQDNGVKKKGLNFKRAFSLGTGYIFARPIRLIVCALLCLLTFTFIGVADTIRAYKWENAILNTMNFYESERYTFKRTRIYEDGQRSESLSLYSNAEHIKNDLLPILDVSRTDKIYLPYRISRVHTSEFVEIVIAFGGFIIDEMNDINRLIWKKRA